MRFFNTAGPVDCQRHYCLPPLERVDLPHILTLIEQQKYFVLHAPRQVGKTSFLLALMAYLNRTTSYRCLYINVEVAQTARGDVQRGMQAILGQLAGMAQYYLHDDYPAEIWSERLRLQGPDTALNDVLRAWSQQNRTPLVLLLDEVDSLVGDTLISLLRQLRAGYTQRPFAFPQTVILCGVRDVRDYRIHASDGEIITGGSAFNVKAESLRLGDFSQADIENLCQQHATETGQSFTPEALRLLWLYTQGQPWLVNALAYEVTFGERNGYPITSDHLIAAKEQLILRRETHLDQLADKLREARVRRVITPILIGDNEPEVIPTDDIRYVIDLGLIREEQGHLTVANPIYQEIIPRELTYSMQRTITHEAAWYILPDGQLDMDKLLAAFQQFFRQHAQHWVERFDYKEAGPQLLLQAFLQRIVNGGGRVEREYGLGRQRTDLLLVWPYSSGTQIVVLELKLLRQSLSQTITDGLRQTWAYLDKTEAAEGHLIIFDRHPERPWSEKIFRRQESFNGQMITVWGM